ncbi:hypothetical protein [Paraoerskovia marina]|uniref:hypothetical protein n=1 Tax=Paraoerskovia marina TaxID=545619 RepID=UPI00049274C5|nr:hypothetical protein [Paraoerskovia marina]
MVAELARLKLRLLVNGFRRSIWLTIGFVLGTLYALALAMFVAGVVVVTGVVDPGVARDAVVLLGALLVAGWWIGPLLTSGMNNALDPRRLAPFGIPRRQLVIGLAVATLIGVGGLALVIVALATVAAWSAHVAVMPVALVGAVCGVATCVVGSSALSAILAPVMESRRARELSGLVIALLGIGAWLVFVGTSQDLTFVISPESFDALLGSLGSVLAWTPLGAAWALAGDVVDGAWLALAARVAIVAATLLLAWRGWSWALARELTGGARQERSVSVDGLGWFGRVASTPTGAVAARAATYWRRDPRYSTSLAFVPIVPVVIIVISGGDLTTSALMLTGPIIAFLLGFGISSDIAYDNSAFALHVTTGVSGRADRWGRVLPVLLVGLPVVVLSVVTTAAASGRWDLLAVTLGVAVMTFLGTLGTSSVASALYLYPVPEPGESPFKSAQSASLAPLVGQFGAIAAAGVASLPVLVLAGLTLFLDLPALGVVTAVAGAVLGAFALVVGVRFGGRVYDRRAPELLQQVLSYR